HDPRILHPIPTRRSSDLDVKAPQIRIPVQMEAPGSNARGVMYTHGKITPMFRMLYANAEYGDITRTSPEARRVKTWTCAVAVPLDRKSTRLNSSHDQISY